MSESTKISNPRVARIAWLAIGLLSLTAAGCVRPDWIEQTLVTVDVTGIWEGNIHSATGSSGGGLALTLEQKGAKVVGTSRFSATGGQNWSAPQRAAHCEELRVASARYSAGLRIPSAEWGAWVL